MAFGRTLEQLPRDEATASNHPFGHRPVKHPSRVIRGLSPDEGMGSMLIHNASDAFITLFLAKQEGAEELDFGVRDWIGRHLDDEEPRDSQGDVDPESPAEGEGEEQDDEGDGSDDA